MNVSRAAAFWWFQALFWVGAGVALFVSGISQTDTLSSAIRNLFLLIAGFLSSFFLAVLIDRLRDFDELRLRLMIFPVAYVIALLCVVTINAITFTRQGIDYPQITWGMWLSGTMNYALVFWFWAELFIQQVYLKGQRAVSPVEQKAAGAERLVVQDRDGKIRLDIADIVAILAAGDYVEIDIGDRVLLDRQTISSLEHRLAPAGLLRVHRSAIVNPAHVRKVSSLGGGRYAMEMSNGRQVSSSRGFERYVREQLL